MKNQVLLIDNYDSFTYNLVQAFKILKANVSVCRNDKITTQEAISLNPSHLVISPGPGRPEDAGISLDIIDTFIGKIPILGVCLGHQCLFQYYGGKIISAKKLMHGKSSLIEHDKKTIFDNLKNPLEVGRYHSLAANNIDIPNELEISAKTSDNEIMGIRDKEKKVEGVQFHPESVLTPDGPIILDNFLNIT
jgi:anthranilate synthase/aminodeoxychorismate synthase-like glutamine amidotransferase|tara:strand:- start:4497 stop:5072 length:576 start_codon:yes stop_codon:yes gene_type:complete